jgi:mannose-6-phosphate isomerase-like protein (cupin superfamily)
MEGGGMRKTTIVVLVSVVWFGPASTAQEKRAATYISAEEIATVHKTPGVDRTVAIVDIGPENFAIGTVHRGRTPAPASTNRSAPAGTPAGRGAAAPAGQPAPEPCGESATTPPAAGTPTGLYHEGQTEGYLITSGSGTMVTGGHIVNGRKSGPKSEVTTTLNGPSCSGFIVGSDVVLKEVKVGDVIIIPQGVPHGWTNIPDHVDYLSFRPSNRVLPAGYVHPTIKK